MREERRTQVLGEDGVSSGCCGVSLPCALAFGSALEASQLFRKLVHDCASTDHRWSGSWMEEPPLLRWGNDTLFLI